MLPAFAEVSDLAARLGDEIAEDSADETRAQAALDDASALIRAEAGKTWVTDDELDDDVPDIVTTVTLRAALRAYQNPEGVSQETVASYSYSLSNDSTDVYLTSNERRLVQKAAGLRGVSVLPTTRGDVPDVDCLTWPGGETYVPVDPAGIPLPVDYP